MEETTFFVRVGSFTEYCTQLLFACEEFSRKSRRREYFSPRISLLMSLAYFFPDSPHLVRKKYFLRTSISSVNNVYVFANKSWLTVSHKLNFAKEIKAINLIDASSWWKLVQLQILEDYNATVCGIFIKTTK